MSLQDQVQQHFGTVVELVNKHGPAAFKIWNEFVAPTLWSLYQKSQRPGFSLFLGFFLLSYGGNFVLTVAVIEAFRLLGLTQLKRNLTDLRDSFFKAKAAYEKDHPSPTPVSQEVQAAVFPTLDAQTKLLAVLKAVDPEKVSSSFLALSTALITVLATLQSQIAQTIAMGASIASLATTPLNDLAQQHIAKVVPPEYQKWALLAISYGTKMFGIFLAFFFQPWVLITNLCMKSATLIVQALIQSEFVPKEQHKLLKLLTSPLAVLGFLKHLLLGYELPLLLWLVAWPALLVESLFGFFVVGSMLSQTAPL